MEVGGTHHGGGQGAPGGTGVTRARGLYDVRANTVIYTYGRHEVKHRREANEIGIHAVRGGTIVGEHEVMFAGEDEIVTLSHSARSRKVFAVGATRAAPWPVAKPAGPAHLTDMLRPLVDCN